MTPDPGHTWAMHCAAALAVHARRPVGLPLALIHDPVSRSPGKPWDGWELRVVGVYWPASVAAVLHAPARNWPLWALVDQDDGADVAVQVWGMRAAPPVGGIWVELRWDPDREKPDLAVRGVLEAGRDAMLAAYDVAEALFLEVTRRGRRRNNALELKARMYPKWFELLAASEDGESPKNTDLADAFGVSVPTIVRWIKTLRDNKIDWTPPGPE